MAIIFSLAESKSPTKVRSVWLSSQDLKDPTDPNSEQKQASFHSSSKLCLSTAFSHLAEKVGSSSPQSILPSEGFPQQIDRCFFPTVQHGLFFTANPSSTVHIHSRTSLSSKPRQMEEVGNFHFQSLYLQKATSRKAKQTSSSSNIFHPFKLHQVAKTSKSNATFQ